MKKWLLMALGSLALAALVVGALVYLRNRNSEGVVDVNVLQPPPSDTSSATIPTSTQQTSSDYSQAELQALEQNKAYGQTVPETLTQTKEYHQYLEDTAKKRALPRNY